jgi:hypothetical protein
MREQSAVVCVVCVDGGAGRCGCVSVLGVCNSLEKADLLKWRKPLMWVGVEVGVVMCD